MYRFFSVSLSAPPFFSFDEEAGSLWPRKREDPPVIAMTRHDVPPEGGRRRGRSAVHKARAPRFHHSAVQPRFPAPVSLVLPAAVELSVLRLCRHIPLSLRTHVVVQSVSNAGILSSFFFFLLPFPPTQLRLLTTDIVNTVNTNVELPVRLRPIRI